MKNSIASLVPFFRQNRFNRRLEGISGVAASKLASKSSQLLLLALSILLLSSLSFAQTEIQGLSRFGGETGGRQVYIVGGNKVFFPSSTYRPVSPLSYFTVYVKVKAFAAGDYYLKISSQASTSFSAFFQGSPGKTTSAVTNISAGSTRLYTMQFITPSVSSTPAYPLVLCVMQRGFLGIGDKQVSGDFTYYLATDATAPAASVGSISNAQISSLAVGWGGSDGSQSSASGIASYSVDWRVDYGSWQSWLSGTTLRSSTFSVSQGHKYGFRVCATDNVGNTGTYDAGLSYSVPWIVSASAGTGGVITPSGNVRVVNGASQLFTVTPSSPFRILSVVVDGLNKGPVLSYTFGSVTANRTISAKFGLPVNASAGTGGTISPSGTTLISYGASQTYAITPSGSFRIAKVFVDGVSKGAISSYTFYNVNSTHTINATFGLPISASAGTGGSITPSGTVVVAYGGSQTYYITPSSPYRIANVVVDGVNKGAISSYTFYNVTSSHTISASFGLPISASAGTGGTISPSGTVIVGYGASKTFSIIPSTGYKILAVVVDGVNKGTISSYTFYNVSSAHSISASFGWGARKSSGDEIGEESPLAEETSTTSHGSLEIPTETVLIGNYPNPFNPTTTIRYGLPERSDVSLVVYNEIGQVVRTLVQEYQEAGYHEVVFNATGLSSGAYFYRMQTGNFVQTRRLLLIK
jgi:hypothetical protein